MATADHAVFYGFQGLSIAIEADRPKIIAALRARLRHLPAVKEGPADLSFTLRSVSREDERWTERPRGKGRSIYDALDGEVLYFADTDQLYIAYRGHIRILCKPALGEVRVSLVAGEDDLRPVAHILFTLPFVELLKRCGYYSLHAAGLCSGNRGLFLPGTSGSGKSTLTLALLRAGFDFMGDDLLFLSRSQERLEVQAFPEDIDVTDETVSFFPELRHLFPPSRSPARPKRQVWPAEHYSTRIVATCNPALLVFPRVAHTGRTTLGVMDRNEAFMELIPNVLLTEPRSSQAHLDAIGELVGRCDCYRLEAGRNFDDIAAQLRELLTE